VRGQRVLSSASHQGLHRLQGGVAARAPRIARRLRTTRADNLRAAALRSLPRRAAALPRLRPVSVLPVLWRTALAVHGSLLLRFAPLLRVLSQLDPVLDAHSNLRGRARRNSCICGSPSSRSRTASSCKASRATRTSSSRRQTRLSRGACTPSFSRSTQPGSQKRASILGRDIPPPSAVVVGMWEQESRILPMPLAPTPKMACLQGFTFPEYAERIRKPIADRQLYLTNNDWIWEVNFEYDCCGMWWAEQTLRQAERVLLEYEGLPRPPWLDPYYYASRVAASRPACKRADASCRELTTRTARSCPMATPDQRDKTLEGKLIATRCRALGSRRWDSRLCGSLWRRACLCKDDGRIRLCAVLLMRSSAGLWLGGDTPLFLRYFRRFIGRLFSGGTLGFGSPGPARLAGVRLRLHGAECILREPVRPLRIGAAR
jgi:hypothetical protein